MSNIITTANGLGDIKTGKKGKCWFTNHQRSKILKLVNEFRKDHSLESSVAKAAAHFDIQAVLKSNTVYGWVKRKSRTKKFAKERVVGSSTEEFGDIISRRKDGRPEFSQHQKNLMCQVFTKYLSEGHSASRASRAVNEKFNLGEMTPAHNSLVAWSKQYKKTKTGQNKQLRNTRSFSSDQSDVSNSDLKEHITTIGKIADDADFEELTECMILIKKVSKTVAAALQVKLQEFTNVLD